MPPFLNILLYYFVGAMIPCNALFGFTMDAKGIVYSDIPAALVTKYSRNALVLLSQVLVATILIAHELWQINLLFAIESTIFGMYERRLL